ncbi:hypothetical protein CPB85DRAFT_778091 [Mucidula mucida]|nr:hypothetical protein CPB85DRAFT_778091 [Mucidula mucida]
MPLILILTNTGNARLLSNIHPTPRFLPLLSTCVFLSLLGALAAVSVNDVSAGNQNDVPSECQARCVVADTLTDEISCTSEFVHSFVECVECVGNNIGVTDYTKFDSLTVQCDAQGLSVPKVTFTGQDPDRPLSPISSTSSERSGSSTSSGSVTSTGFNDNLNAAVWVNLQLVAAIGVIVVGAVVGARL